MKRGHVKVDRSAIRGGGLWGLLVKLVVLAFRFAFGAPMDGRRRTNATFWTRGAVAATGLPDWIGPAAPTRWSYLPGWVRAAIRWACVGVLWAYVVYPTTVTVTASSVVASAGGWQAASGYESWRTRKHRREVVRPAYLVLCQYLGTAPTDKPERWLFVPEDVASNRDAVVGLAFPEGFDANKQVRDALAGVIDRHMPGQWESTFTSRAMEWRRAPEPPRYVAYQELEPQKFSMHEIPVGMGPRRQVVSVSTETASPHWMVTTDSGGGKSSLLRIPVAHTRSHGALTDIIDLKMTSFMDTFDDVPGVRIHTDVESAIYALSEFYVSMLGANTAVMKRELTREEIPARNLVIDEFGSLMTLARRWWKRQGNRGEPPFLDAFLLCLYQGREGNHRLTVGVHQPNLKVFGTSDARDLFDVRIMGGAYTNSKWRMTFGYVAQLEYDDQVDGRGVVGFGENDVREIQRAFLSKSEARDIALSGSEPPQWFQDHNLPPWVTDRVLDQARREAGVEISSPPQRPHGSPGDQSADLPTDAPWNALPPASDAAGDGTAPQGSHLRLVTRNDEPWIVGLDAAADYLTRQGWQMSRQAFRDARKTKNAGPIPGEEKNEKGQPCWRPSDLRNWQSRRKIAGRRNSVNEGE